MSPLMEIASATVWFVVGSCTSALGQGARPYNTCILKLKVSLLLYNFIDKGNAELQSSLRSLRVALSKPILSSRYKLVIIDLCFVVFSHFCVEFLL
jgi:hypothetical protein